MIERRQHILERVLRRATDLPIPLTGWGGLLLFTIYIFICND
jgi:hypothetical protein